MCKDCCDSIFIVLAGRTLQLKHVNVYLNVCFCKANIPSLDYVGP